MTAPEVPGDERILTPDALRFLKELHQKFDTRRLQLLAQRRVIQASIDDSKYFPDFDPATKNLREDRNWFGANIPEDMMVS
uniref:Malate synthase n=1 Tax=Parascaris equorum TaxID=6256 RepID=A0A914RVX9_PAREQ